MLFTIIHYVDKNKRKTESYVGVLTQQLLSQEEVSFKCTQYCIKVNMGSRKELIDLEAIFVKERKGIWFCGKFSMVNIHIKRLLTINLVVVL